MIVKKKGLSIESSFMLITEHNYIKESYSPYEGENKEGLRGPPHNKS